MIEGAVEPEISPELRKLVQTRVRLRNVDHYSNLKKIGFLVAAEIGDLGSRIRHYQYIERYRFAMEPLSPEMSAAFAPAWLPSPSRRSLRYTRADGGTVSVPL